ncbi:MAG: hypothetical protein ACXAC7_04790 [Candidatus Hodarchaeales archaeon]
MDDIETIRIVKTAILEQYGATFKMLENLINNCPNEYWDSSENEPPFYKVVYHTMFFIDMYLSGTKEESNSFMPRFPKQEDYRTSEENFQPTEENALTKKELLDYLSDLKIKGNQRIDGITLQELINESVFD